MNHDLPEHLHYTRDHEWLEIDGDEVTLGVTDYAQEALGELVFVELPEVGSELDAGDSCAVVESVKAASEVFSPISGQVMHVNTDLAAKPEAINTNPYDDGWICKIQASDPAELKDLMTAEDYQNYLTGMAD